MFKTKQPEGLKIDRGVKLSHLEGREPNIGL